MQTHRPAKSAPHQHKSGYDRSIARDLPRKSPSYSCPLKIQKPAIASGWQNSSLQDTTFVYSAYYDARKHEITTIAIASIDTENISRLCYVWFEQSKFPDVVPAVKLIVPETHDTK